MTELEYVNFIKEETDLDREADLYSLEHHGVKGQRWGIRRTPAQLGHKTSSGKKKKSESIVSKVKKSIKKKKAKKAKVEKAKAKKEELSKEDLKKKVLSSSDPKFIYEHMNLLDSKELQDRIDRITKETKIKELATPKKKDLYKQTEEFLKTTASMAESVTKIYNAYNVVSGKKGGNKKDSDKKGDKKDSDKKEDKKDDKKDKDKDYVSPKGKKNLQKAVNDMLNDPAVQAIMNAPGGLTQKDRARLIEEAKAENEKRKKAGFSGIRGQRWIHN